MNLSNKLPNTKYSLLDRYTYHSNRMLNDSLSLYDRRVAEVKTNKIMAKMLYESKDNKSKKIAGEFWSSYKRLAKKWSIRA